MARRFFTGGERVYRCGQGKVGQGANLVPPQTTVPIAIVSSQLDQALNNQSFDRTLGGMLG